MGKVGGVSRWTHMDVHHHSATSPSALRMGQLRLRLNIDQGPEYV